jgi:hypothetical protein
MQRRPWEATIHAMIGLAGRKGEPVAERCPAHPIRHTPDSQWREPCLAHAANALAGQAQSQRDARVAREPAPLKARVGELTLA